MGGNIMTKNDKKKIVRLAEKNRQDWETIESLNFIEWKYKEIEVINLETAIKERNKKITELIGGN
jgi:hypothetical protein